MTESCREILLLLFSLSEWHFYTVLIVATPSDYDNARDHDMS
jgi:hypothetical protein